MGIFVEGSYKRGRIKCIEEEGTAMLFKPISRKSSLDEGARVAICSQQPKGPDKFHGRNTVFSSIYTNLQGNLMKRSKNLEVHTAHENKKPGNQS